MANNLIKYSKMTVQTFLHTIKLPHTYHVLALKHITIQPNESQPCTLNPTGLNNSYTSCTLYFNCKFAKKVSTSSFKLEFHGITPRNCYSEQCPNIKWKGFCRFLNTFLSCNESQQLG